ncbi:DUF6153 family protein [Streptomyces sp. NBC_01235]|uniref:DUF6153 family protein n=1 Tax=Streptomyces sp. NBC_01235 TaxID=2903788 RepID=UPI002E109B54|nr:DUF6153 family protein [Streptomyces sp. NBC_01235]
MTVRNLSWPQTGGAARWVRGVLVTLCAVVAVLLHHGLPDSPVTATSTASPHAMSEPRSAPAAHPHTASPAAVAAHGSDGASCPSMAMQLCTAAGVSTLQLVAPPESPTATFPTRITVLTGVDIARSVNRAPPDLSLLSQLRI